MTATKTAIDCDVHPTVPNLKALLPHFDDYWRNSIAERGIPGFEANSYPPRAPRRQPCATRTRSSHR